MKCGPTKRVPPSTSRLSLRAGSAARAGEKGPAKAAAPSEVNRSRRFMLASRSMSDVLLEPVLRLLVPEQRVLRLEDPVILVRKIHEFARYAARLQRVEQLEAVIHRHAHVELAVDHQRRGVEVTRGGVR